MTDANPLPPHTWQALRAVFRRFPKVRAVWLYGSRARGEAHPGSDIDLAISAPEMSDAEFARLWDAIDASPVAFKMDVLHWERLDNPALRAQILQDRVLLYPEKR